jgi:hypothetical protein
MDDEGVLIGEVDLDLRDEICAVYTLSADRRPELYFEGKLKAYLPNPEASPR